MAKALDVQDLYKIYPSFSLGPLSFSVEKGLIAGLIGRNGAGKSTTLKSIMGLTSSDGTIRIFGKEISKEIAVKELIGYAGGFHYYPDKRLSAIAHAVSRFYPHWDGEVFRHYTEVFSLVLTKKVRELSDGMKVKFALALSLSHGAELLLLDEPTSGLDPISREELCDTLLSLKDQGVTVLFSTHITSDLMRVADKIIYLSEGKLLAEEPLSALLRRYRLQRFSSCEEAKRAQAIGIKRVKDGFEGLVADPAGSGNATLDEIMVHLEYAKKETA